MLTEHTAQTVSFINSLATPNMNDFVKLVGQEVSESRSNKEWKLEGRKGEKDESKGEEEESKGKQRRAKERKEATEGKREGGVGIYCESLSVRFVSV